MDIDGVYDDLPSFDLAGDLEKLQQRNSELQSHITSLESDVTKLSATVQDLKRTQEVLQRNISELFNTAKSELERKDRLIADLRRELENHIFRRHAGDNQLKRSRDSSPLIQKVVPESIPKRAKIEERYDDRRQQPPRRERSRSRSREMSRKPYHGRDRGPRDNDRSRYRMENDSKRNMSRTSKEHYPENTKDERIGHNDPNRGQREKFGASSIQERDYRRDPRFKMHPLEFYQNTDRKFDHPQEEEYSNDSTRRRPKYNMPFLEEIRAYRRNTDEIVQETSSSNEEKKIETPKAVPIPEKAPIPAKLSPKRRKPNKNDTPEVVNTTDVDKLQVTPKIQEVKSSNKNPKVDKNESKKKEKLAKSVEADSSKAQANNSKIETEKMTQQYKSDAELDAKTKISKVTKSQSKECNVNTFETATNTEVEPSISKITKKASSPKRRKHNKPKSKESEECTEKNVQKSKLKTEKDEELTEINVSSPKRRKKDTKKKEKENVKLASEEEKKVEECTKQPEEKCETPQLKDELKKNSHDDKVMKINQTDSENDKKCATDIDKTNENTTVNVQLPQSGNKSSKKQKTKIEAVTKKLFVKASVEAEAAAAANESDSKCLKTSTNEDKETTEKKDITQENAETMKTIEPETDLKRTDEIPSKLKPCKTKPTTSFLFDEMNRDKCLLSEEKTNPKPKKTAKSKKLRTKSDDSDKTKKDLKLNLNDVDAKIAELVNEESNRINDDGKKKKSLNEREESPKVSKEKESKENDSTHNLIEVLSEDPTSMPEIKTQEPEVKKDENITETTEEVNSARVLRSASRKNEPEKEILDDESKSCPENVNKPKPKKKFVVSPSLPSIECLTHDGEIPQLHIFDTSVESLMIMELPSADNTPVKSHKKAVDFADLATFTSTPCAPKHNDSLLRADLDTSSLHEQSLLDISTKNEEVPSISTSNTSGTSTANNSANGQRLINGRRKRRCILTVKN